VTWCSYYDLKQLRMGAYIAKRLMIELPVPGAWSLDQRSEDANQMHNDPEVGCAIWFPRRTPALQRLL
jgi:hypothetical protein